MIPNPQAEKKENQCFKVKFQGTRITLPESENWLTYSKRSSDCTKYCDSKLSGNLIIDQKPKQVNCGNIWPYKKAFQMVDWNNYIVWVK